MVMDVESDLVFFGRAMYTLLLPSFLKEGFSLGLISMCHQWYFCIA